MFGEKMKIIRTIYQECDDNFVEFSTKFLPICREENFTFAWVRASGTEYIGSLLRSQLLVQIVNLIQNGLCGIQRRRKLRKNDVPCGNWIIVWQLFEGMSHAYTFRSWIKMDNTSIMVMSDTKKYRFNRSTRERSLRRKWTFGCDYWSKRQNWLEKIKGSFIL